MYLHDEPTAPITHCVSGCRRRYVINPVRHTLAQRDHLPFRLSELREGARSGDQLIFRIRVDPGQRDLVPLVVLRDGNGWFPSAELPRQIADCALTDGAPSRLRPPRVILKAP